MTDWDFTAPAKSELLDTEVAEVSKALAGKRIALLVCASIAAYRAPDLNSRLTSPRSFCASLCF